MSVPQYLKDLERFYHILECIELIEKYTKAPMSLSDGKTADAVFYRLQIIGEAARHISDDYKNQFLDIPWRRMVAMRNYLVHEYFAVHHDKIIAAVSDIPRIKERLKEIIVLLDPDAKR